MDPKRRMPSVSLFQIKLSMFTVLCHLLENKCYCCKRPFCNILIYKIPIRILPHLKSFCLRPPLSSCPFSRCFNHRRLLQVLLYLLSLSRQLKPRKHLELVSEVASLPQSSEPPLKKKKPGTHEPPPPPLLPPPPHRPLSSETLTFF